MPKDEVDIKAIKEQIKDLEKQKEHTVITEYISDKKKKGGEGVIYHHKQMKKYKDSDDANEELLKIEYFGRNKKKVDGAISTHLLLLSWLKFINNKNGDPKDHISKFVCILNNNEIGSEK